jgi:hypothetical protein
MSSCSWVQLSLIWRASYWPGSVYCGDDDEGLSMTSGRRLYERATKATSDFDPIASGSSAGISNSSCESGYKFAERHARAIGGRPMCYLRRGTQRFKTSRPDQSIRRRKPHHVSSLTASHAIEALERARRSRTAPLTASAWPISFSIESRVEKRVRTRLSNSSSSAAGNAAIGCNGDLGSWTSRHLCSVRRASGKGNNLRPAPRSLARGVEARRQ